MKFTETDCADAWIVDIDEISDDRGFFARAFCRDEFRARKLRDVTAQINVSLGHAAGTVRGMHLQLPPYTEAKLIRCTKGVIFDVIVDLRPNSPTYLKHVGVELSAENRRALYVPDLFAHGYQTLTDGAEVLYQSSEFYTPGYERGIRHDDPALGLRWPVPVSVISTKDATWPDFDPERPLW